MPNWMNNNLSISGSEADIQAFIHKAAEQPGRNSGILSFGNFVQPVASHEDSQAMAWGCKWDAMEVKVLRKGNGYVNYTFVTPWSAPFPVLKAMSEQFPNLIFSLTSIEEQGWGEELISSQGKLRIVKQWDAPKSHQEMIEVLGYCSCKDESEDIFNDCNFETVENHV
jgi:hypothetical protein